MSSGDASWPVALFGERVGLKLVIAACDALLASVTIDDTLWTSLRAIFNEEAILEIVMPCGFYRTVSARSDRGALSGAVAPATVLRPPRKESA